MKKVSKKEPFSRILETVPRSGIREFFDLVMSAGDIISLGVGEPDFSTPWTIRSEAIYALEKGLTSYTSNYGLLELRSAISKYLKDYSGPSYDPATEVLVTNGVSEAVDIVLRAILNPGDEVILPQPAYVCYEPLVKLVGAKIVPIDTSKTGFAPTAKAIQKAITPKTKALILCSPSNPTGAVISEASLKEIAKVARDADIWVLSDEIYGELSYEQEHVSISKFPGMRERTAILHGFSKAFAMTGWRVGYVAGPEALVSRACKIHQYSALCASIISQYAALEALKSGHTDRLNMHKSYFQRRNLFVSGLNSAGLKTALPGGAFYCFPDIRSTGMSSDQFARTLIKEESVAVVPGHVFGAGGEGYVRCCYATEMNQLKEALKRIHRFVKRHQKKS